MKRAIALMVSVLLLCGATLAYAEPSTEGSPGQGAAEIGAEPNVEPGAEIATEPSVEPTVQADAESGIGPEAEFSAEPDVEPSPSPGAEPSPSPSAEPSPSPSAEISAGQDIELNEMEAMSEPSLIQGFVERMYTKALGRTADRSGVAYWTKSLEEGKDTGASIGANFLLGTEMQGLNLSDDEYLNRLYRTFMNREADAGGKAYWKGFLEKGCGRKYVLAGFINSKEFGSLCTSYGILQGQYQSPESRDKNPAATAFVNRLYQVCFGRAGDADGLNYWTLQLLNGKVSGATTAYQFIFGKEFTSKNLSDGAYLDYLYEAFMGRKADAEGKKYWQGFLDKGCSRKLIFANFSSSKEFSSICTSHGILRGSYRSPEARDQNPQATAFVKRMYETCLGRSADAGGLNYWTGRLNSGSMTGTGIAYDFFASKEFTGKGFSNSAYVDKLYEAVMGRTADASGKQYWLGTLSSMRKTRRTLLSAFMDSKEFTGLCSSYGIQRGAIEKPGRVEDFINAALDQLGKPYKLGGKGPNEFDCSGFIYYALRQSGNNIPYMTSGGWAESNYPTIALDDLRRGDIICMPGHVAIYLGEGRIVDASTSNNAIVMRYFWGMDSVICGKRPL